MDENVRVSVLQLIVCSTFQRFQPIAQWITLFDLSSSTSIETKF